MVYKFTDTMAALISNAFSLSFILFDRLVAYFLEWRVVTDQDAVSLLYTSDYIRVDDLACTMYICRQIQLLMRRGQVETKIDHTEPLTKVFFVYQRGTILCYLYMY